MSNRVAPPPFLDNFPFGVKFDHHRQKKALKTGILQPTFRDYDFLALENSGLMEPHYYTMNEQYKVLVFKPALRAPIPDGFSLQGGVLVYRDEHSRVFVPSMDSIFLLIAATSTMPYVLRSQANLEICPTLDRLIFRSLDNDFSIDRIVPELDTSEVYVPQSGDLSSCVQAKEAVQVCVSDVLDTVVEATSTPVKVLDPMLDWCGLPKDSMTLALHLATFRKPMYSLAAALAMYVLVSFIKDFCLTLKFVFGFILGRVCSPKPKKPTSLIDLLYSPHGGVLASDDGAAFTGTKEKKTTSSSGASAPAVRSSPGISATPSIGFSQGVRTAPPKPTKKDQNDGLLKGFGVGI